MTAAWVACECDATPCICYIPPPQIGPADRAEAERLRDEMAASGSDARAWFANFIDENSDELAEALSRPVEDLIAEALAAREGS
ncbi:hypothetical protein Caci_2917 [Catenulispora acidiphila DSM 44928]|uniref:Uncharacterized protein n=1 Tax=Catenulispora acidiphila (strain DSM 44928 / JCM 14897 / NBRC 102108 / NRRL B-24433 / ID139908) TaxID=479433 RepID=C7Q2T4_CATAD|nr:hypothetical protein [Catenulispora acidiphila]ACU71826.1 hypothetical protein Caci_2917 [Catenulispora acidiphila DSM 44928]